MSLPNTVEVVAPQQHAAIASGAVSTPGCTEEAVERLYSDYPYPPRDPSLEVPGIISFRMHEDPNLLRSVLFGGQKLPSKFTALIVGGGTGDATVHLALGLARVGARRSTIYHFDLSQPSIDIAEERIRKHKRQLRRAKISVKFRHGPLSRITEAIGRGKRFHYINAVGVLHHLPDPSRGLESLSKLLTDDGTMAIAVYASVGRTGVYHLREMARIVARSRLKNDADKIKDINLRHVIPSISDAEDVMKSMTTTSLFAKNDMLVKSVDISEFGQSGIADMIVNPCDVSFSIKDVSDMVSEAGLRIHQPVDAERYEPVEPYPESLDNLPWLERASFAELQKGDILMHHLWLTRDRSGVESAMKRLWDRHSILCLADWVPEKFQDSMEEQSKIGLQDADVRFQAAMGGDKSEKESDGLPALGPALLSRIDCSTTLEDHFEAIVAKASWLVTWDLFIQHAREWQQAMNGANAILHTY